MLQTKLVHRAGSLGDVLFGLLLTNFALLLDIDRLLKEPSRAIEPVIGFFTCFIILAVLWSVHSVLMADVFVPDIFGYAMNFGFFFCLIDWSLAVQLKLRMHTGAAVEVVPLSAAFAILAVLFLKGIIERRLRDGCFTWATVVAGKNIFFCSIAAIFVARSFPLLSGTYSFLGEIQVVALCLAIAAFVNYYADQLFDWLKDDETRAADRRNKVAGLLLGAIAIVAHILSILVWPGINRAFSLIDVMLLVFVLNDARTTMKMPRKHASGENPATTSS